MKGSPLWITLFWQISINYNLIITIHGAIIPPPWADPTKNPCASYTGGWQLLYWAPLKQCFKIFTIGYPCPETMELSPASSNDVNSMMIAECRCPPGTAYSALSSKCHTLFERGPCDAGQYFSPIQDPPIRSAIPKKRWGICKTIVSCLNGMIFWPLDSKCYPLHTRGPCAKGKLISVGKDKIAECKCENRNGLAPYFYDVDDTCHEHFTRGPCDRIGELFLPGGKCGCHVELPNYHKITDQCFEIGTIGPCPMGHIFILSENSISTTTHATCQCKDGYVLWSDGNCYRLYTKGPCTDGEFILSSSNCTRNPCGKGRLYFPDEKTCYRIGSPGPCRRNQVVVFDFTTRPSIDGISYNGVCGCSGIITNLDQKCTPTDENDTIDQKKNQCESMSGMIEFMGQCHKLFSRGPCGPGQWLELRKIINRNDKRGAHCQCRSGYTKYETVDGNINCHAPSVGIARWFLKLIGYDNDSSS